MDRNSYQSKKNTILMNADSFLNYSSFITGSCADSQASNSSSVKSIIHQVKKSTVGNLKSRNSQKRGTLNFTDNLSCLEASDEKKMNMPWGWREGVNYRPFHLLLPTFLPRNSAWSKHFSKSNTKLFSNCWVSICFYQAFKKLFTVNL